MAQNTSGRGTRYNSKKPDKKPTTHRIRNLFLLLVVVAAFMLFSYLGYLDFNVRKQFEGKRWAVPARVYASPVELYTGHAMTLDKLEVLLKMLHYRNDSTLAAEGSYFSGNGRSV